MIMKIYCGLTKILNATLPSSYDWWSHLTWDASTQIIAHVSTTTVPERSLIETTSNWARRMLILGSKSGVSRNHPFELLVLILLSEIACKLI